MSLSDYTNLFARFFLNQFLDHLCWKWNFTMLMNILNVYLMGDVSVKSFENSRETNSGWSYYKYNVIDISIFDGFDKEKLILHSPEWSYSWLNSLSLSLKLSSFFKLCWLLKTTNYNFFWDFDFISFHSMWGSESFPSV